MALSIHALFAFCLVYELHFTPKEVPASSIAFSLSIIMFHTKGGMSFFLQLAGLMPAPLPPSTFCANVLRLQAVKMRDERPAHNSLEIMLGGRYPASKRGLSVPL